MVFFFLLVDRTIVWRLVVTVVVVVVVGQSCLSLVEFVGCVPLWPIDFRFIDFDVDIGVDFLLLVGWLRFRLLELVLLSLPVFLFLRS